MNEKSSKFIKQTLPQTRDRVNTHDETRDSPYLSDLSLRDKPWDTHRHNADLLQQIYAESGESRLIRNAERMSICAFLLRFGYKLDKETRKKFLRLREAYFCHCRHCPICQWRKSLMLRARFYEALPNIMTEYPKARWLFAVFTVKNCPVTELRQTIQGMGEAWRRLRVREEFKPVQGWIRTTEVTVGKQGFEYAHPHFNALLMVPSYWFKTSAYVKHERWVELWQECARLDYEPSVRISALKQGGDIAKLVAETVKYAVKESDLVRDAEWVVEYTKQVHHLRFIASGGVLKGVFKDLDKATNEELIQGEGEGEIVDDDDGARLAFAWDRPVKKYRRKPFVDIS